MRGLLEKDFCLTMQRKGFGAFLILAVILGASVGGTFIMGYLPVMMIALMCGTVSYDEFDNGYQFLMTLPIDEKLYVREKYLFCFAGALLSWVLSAILYYVIGVLQTKDSTMAADITLAEQLPTALAYLMVIVLFLLFMLPVQLKFGAEKSRIVILGTGGAIGAISYLAVKMLGEDRVAQLWMRLEQVSDEAFLLATIAFLLAATLFSYWISCRIMQKKEF